MNIYITSNRYVIKITIRFVGLKEQMTLFKYLSTFLSNCLQEVILRNIFLSQLLQNTNRDFALWNAELCYPMSTYINLF